MKILFLINDAPYGTEKFYNSCRLAITIQKENIDMEVNVLFIADAMPLVALMESKYLH